MKIILQDLTMTKVYEYKLIEDKTTNNGYVSSNGSSIVSDENASTFIYNCSAYKYLKVVSTDNKNIAPYARFVDSNNTLVGTVISYTAKGETELTVPSGATQFQITDTYNSRSNVVSVYGKKG